MRRASVTRQKKKCRRIIGGTHIIANQKPNWAAVSRSVSAERLRAASSRSETGVLMREFTPLRLSNVGTDMHTSEMPWKSLSSDETGRMRLESLRMASMMSTPDMAMA